MKSIWWLFLIPVFASCATHAPMSEMVMYSPKEVYSPYQSDTLIYFSKYSFAVGLETRFLNPNPIEKYADREIDVDNENGTAENYVTAGALSLHSIFMIDGETDFAFNISMFPTLGIDFTAKLTEQEYVTFGHTLYGGQQIILQRRLVYNSYIGASVGLFYEHFWQGYDVPIDCGFCGLGPEREFYLNASGVRGTIMSHDGTKNRGFFRFSSKIGYIYETRSFYTSFGLSFGVF